MVAGRLVTLVAGVQQRERRLTLGLDVEDAQRGVFAAGAGGRASGVVALQLLDDGGELGVQRRSARLGPRGRRRARGVLLLLVVAGSGRCRRRSGGAGRSRAVVGLSVGGRGRCAALLAAAEGGGAGGGGGAAGARTRRGGFGLGGTEAPLHRQVAGAVEQRRPVGPSSVLLAADEEAAVRLLDLVVDHVCDALKLAG